MTSNAISTSGSGHPRLRRCLGGLAVTAALAVPLASAPPASAQTANNPLGGIEDTLAGTITGLPNTLTHPLGGSSGDGPPGRDACVRPQLISPLLSCVIDALADLLGATTTQPSTKSTLSRRVRSFHKQTRAIRFR